MTSDPLTEFASERRGPLLRVCGDCAEKLLALGCIAPKAATEITYGTMCEVHPTLVGRAATNVLEAVDGWDKDWEREQPLTDLESMVDDQRIVDVASRLLASWTAEEKGANADGFMVVHALDTARLLLSKVKGGGA